MNWNKSIRQIHRWLSVVLTLAMLLNVVAIVMKKYSATTGLVAVVPFAFLFLTGAYLFVLPYAARWSRRTSGKAEMRARVP